MPVKKIKTALCADIVLKCIRILFITNKDKKEITAFNIFIKTKGSINEKGE